MKCKTGFNLFIAFVTSTRDTLFVVLHVDFACVSVLPDSSAVFAFRTRIFKRGVTRY